MTLNNIQKQILFVKGDKFINLIGSFQPMGVVLLAQRKPISYYFKVCKDITFYSFFATS